MELVRMSDGLGKAYARLIQFQKEHYKPEDITKIEEETNKLIGEFRADGILIFADQLSMFDQERRVITKVEFKYETLFTGYVDSDSIQYTLTFI